MIILLVIIQFYIDNLIIFGESLFIGDSENYLIRLCLKTALNINDHTDKKKTVIHFFSTEFRI
jgi:hypothetical protein